MPSRQKRRPNLPPADHAARYCHHQRVIRDPVTSQILGVFPQAFELRPKIKETYLSLNHFECLGGTLNHQYKTILKVLRSKKLPCPASAALARVNAGAIIACGNECGHSLRLRPRPRPTDPSYVGLEGLPLDNSDQALLAKLARRTCVEIRAIADIDAAPAN
jgi:hypothetical protein